MCLIFNVYVCACESMYQCVKVRRCVFIWDRLFKSEFIRIYICVCVTPCTFVLKFTDVFVYCEGYA